jgi:3-deoxy-D-manno-octulosonic-acid transferase
MWKIIYNILVNLALPPFVLYALTKKKVRENLLERLSVTTKGLYLKDALWIHAASVGEAAIAENIINYLKQYTDLNRFMVTTNTYYARDMLRARFGNEVPVFSMPLDLGYLVSHFIHESRFKALIIIETEIWPNLIWQAKKRGIPVVIVNGRISDKTINTYRRFSPFLNEVFHHVSRVATQSEEHRQRFISIGMDPKKVTATGNIKYCRMMNGIGETETKNMAITFGSIKEKELEIVLPVIISLKKDFKDIQIYVAPRELHLTPVIQSGLSKLFHVTRYSTIKDGKKAMGKDDIVIIDTIGDLVSIYSKSIVAFVGGSLAPYGGQNILEPLFFGTPVIFGPFMENFKDIADIVLENKAGLMVSNGNDLYAAIKNIILDEPLRSEMGDAGRLIIQQQQDVMKKTIDIVMDIINTSNGLMGYS